MSSSTESALTKVYDAGGDTGVAIIFVHGLGGNWLSTWRSGSDISAFWPTWLANDIGGLSVYSVRYDASPSKWQGAALPLVDRATNLFEVLAVEEALRDRSIVFVCHSLGGLVVKTILRIAADREDVRQDAKRLLQKTRGVVFLGTPHLGSRHANLADFFRVLFRLTASTLDLRKDNAELRDLNNWYRNWATNRQIKHLVFAETRATLIGALVDQSSADPGIYKTDSIPIDADHNSLVKPATKQALVYKLVCYFLLSLFPQKLKAAFAERVDTAQFQEDMNLGASAKPLLLDRLANYFLGKPLKALFALSTATLAIAASVLAIWTTLLPCTEKWLSSADYQACFEETVQNRDVYPVMVRGKQNFLGNELIRSEWRTYPVDASSFCWYSCSRLNSRTLNRVNIQMSSEGYNPISITSFRGANEREIYMVTWQKFVAADGQCGKQLNCRGEEQ